MIQQSDILNAKIFIVDDQELSVVLLKGILLKEGFRNIITTTDSREAADMFAEHRPDVMILDIDMPHIDGFGVLKQLRDLKISEYLPVLILTNLEDINIRNSALESGARDFLLKPYDRFEVTLRIKNLLEIVFLQKRDHEQKQILERMVLQRTEELYESQVDVIQRLSKAVEWRDNETGSHILRMSNYSFLVAQKMGLNEDECKLILTASPLHDIGKIAIADSILQKPGKLTPEEWEIMKTHTTIGHDLLDGSDSPYLVMGKKIALTHHEKWNGKGYPHGLSGKDIFLEGRICALCDVFDALTSERPYKKAWGMKETLELLKEESGQHFDPNVVDCFFHVLPEVYALKSKFDDSENEKMNLKKKVCFEELYEKNME